MYVSFAKSKRELRVGEGLEMLACIRGGGGVCVSRSINNGRLMEDLKTVIASGCE